jgi:hypothetical protein
MYMKALVTAVVMIDRMFPALRARKQRRIQSRRRAIQSALDLALQQIARVAPLQNRDVTMDDARLAVKASHFHCRDVAQAAQTYLLAAGTAAVVCHYVGGHYVLLDRQSGLLHDLEMPQGCAEREELPIWSRSKELACLPKESTTTDEDALFDRYAAAWLTRRQNDRCNKEMHANVQSMAAAILGLLVVTTAAAQDAVPLHNGQGNWPIGREQVQCTLVDAKGPGGVRTVSSSVQDAWEWPIGEHIAAYAAVINSQPSDRIFVPPAGSECSIVKVGRSK